MRNSFIFFIFILFSFSCKQSNIDSSRENVLVTVKDRMLTREEIEQQIPKNISSSDSLLMAESLVKKWVTDVLVDAAAYQNVGDDKAEIDKLVDEYRRSLIRYYYQKRLVKDKISAYISEESQKQYYEKNKQQFVLSSNLIKGLFLKIPVGAPGLEKVRKWYVSDSEDALEKIEKYSIQNAVVYDYFYDHWVNFDDVTAKIPQSLSNPLQLLRMNNHFEVSDSTYYYFLNISDHLLVGDVAPFEYVQNQIHDVLVNQRKIDFLQDFEENIYLDAVKKGDVKFVKETK